MRQCKKCHKYKDARSFTKNKNCLNGIEHTCRQCTTKKALKWEYANIDKHQNSYYASRFGINKEKYDAMFKEQGGVCAICKQPSKDTTPKGNIKRLSVDHCHETGIVRGLLCRPCNLGLGHFLDKVSYFENAIAYLKKHR